VVIFEISDHVVAAAVLYCNVYEVAFPASHDSCVVLPRKLPEINPDGVVQPLPELNLGAKI
jgi:hypothetical protein